MKKRNILLGVLTGFAALATLVSCGTKKNNAKDDNKNTTTKEVTTTSNTTSTNDNSTTTSDTTSWVTGNATALPFIDYYIVTRDQYIETVQPLDGQPQEKGYTGAEVQYSITKDGSTSNGTWYYTYNTETNKWVGEDEDAQAAQNEHYILNYSITSRIGNPFATLTFYVDYYAQFRYGVEEESDSSTSSFAWDDFGNIRYFACSGWFWGDSATFTYSWSK